MTTCPRRCRTLVDELWAVHSNAYDYAAQYPTRTAEASRYHREVFAATVYETEHPVVRIHPVTGERGHWCWGISFSVSWASTRRIRRRCSRSCRTM